MSRESHMRLLVLILVFNEEATLAIIVGRVLAIDTSVEQIEDVVVCERLCVF